MSARATCVAGAGVASAPALEEPPAWLSDDQRAIWATLDEPAREFLVGASRAPGQPGAPPLTAEVSQPAPSFVQPTATGEGQGRRKARQPGQVSPPILPAAAPASPVQPSFAQVGVRLKLGQVLGQPLSLPLVITDAGQATLLVSALDAGFRDRPRPTRLAQFSSKVLELFRAELGRDKQTLERLEAEVLAEYPGVLQEAQLTLEALPRPDRSALVAAYLAEVEPYQSADAASSKTAPGAVQPRTKSRPPARQVAERAKTAIQPAVSSAAQPSSAMIAVEPEQMALYVEQARDLLARCSNIGDAKSILSNAEAVRAYARSVHASLAAQAAAEEVVLRARRRLGELTRDLPKAAAGRKSNLSQAATDSATTKEYSLAELGVSRQEASRLEKLARIAQADLDTYISTAKAAGKTPTSSGALALAKAKNAASSTLPYALAEAARMRSQIGKLKALRSEMAQASAEWTSHPEAGLTEIVQTWNGAASDLDRALAAVEQIWLPKEACPCGGAAPCQKCSGRGWLPHLQRRRAPEREEPVESRQTPQPQDEDSDEAALGH